ncbi:MAG TPA: hypothetical protein K8U95_08140 [Pseudomonas nitrititolerans]|nr:hypothetical protein [Stutzerimonas nitrititolerans]
MTIELAGRKIIEFPLLTRKRELLLFAQLVARSADKLRAQAVELSGYLLIRLITVLTRLLAGSFFACNIPQSL